jgi:histidinol phosphatase-like PHP family hydrolase
VGCRWPTPRRSASPSTTSTRDTQAAFVCCKGIEANIDAAGQIDLTDDEAATFDVVLAAPHSKLRKERRSDESNAHLPCGIPAVRILAHPRGPHLGLACRRARQLGRGVRNRRAAWRGD